MIRRLVEAHYFSNFSQASAAQARFWLLELRTPQLLTGVAQARAGLARQLAARRPLLHHAISGRQRQLERALAVEENRLRQEDKTYWSPLFKELEKLRHP